MTQEKEQSYINRLTNEIDNRDIEGAHGEADDILCELLIELGYQKVVDEYNNIPKWYV